MPPSSAGSTLRVASTVRPAAFSIWSTIFCASSSVSSRAVVSSTARRCSSRAIKRSNSFAISSSSPARPFSAVKRRKFLNSGSSSPARSERIDAFAEDSTCGFRSTARRRCGARRLFRPLELREVERADRLGDELAVAVGVELSADDDRRRLERQVGDLGADPIERTRRLRSDLAPRVLEPPLPLGLGLLTHAQLHRLARAPGLGEYMLRVSARLVHEGAVLLEQLSRLGARVLSLLDRLADLLAAPVEHLLDRAERVALQHEQGDEEADDRPDHQPRRDRDERVRAEEHQTRT